MIGKTAAYMEAVCYFCMCAIHQYRVKKAAGTLTSKSILTVDLLKETYELLKYGGKFSNDICTVKLIINLLIS